MTQDKKTIHLIFWMVFCLAILAALCYEHGLMTIASGQITDPVQLTTVQAMSDKAATGLAAVGVLFVGTLARVRTDPQTTTGDTPGADTGPVEATIVNTTSNPVITEPQSPIEQVSPDDALPAPPPVAVRNTQGEETL